MIMIYGEILKS